VLGAALGLVCGFSAVFLGSAGIFLKPMAASFHWSRADVAALPTFGVAGIAIGAPLLGHLADRTGWKKVIACSVAAFSLGLFALSVSPPNRAYIVGCGLLTGILGAATTPAGYIAVISRAFQRRLGTALGFSMMGVGVGVTIMPIVVNKLIALTDWREAYACLGSACLVLGLLAHWIIFRQPIAIQGALGAPKTDFDPNEGVAFGQAVRDYRFWLIGIVAAFVGGTTAGALIHLDAYATDRGMSPAVAAQSVGFVGLGILASRLGAGLMLDVLFGPLVACGAFLLAAAGFCLLTGDVQHSPALLPVAAILIGLAGGAEGDIIPFLAKKYFGIRSIGTVYGALMGIFALGASSGAYVYGLAFDRLKSYLPIFQASAALCGICGLSIMLLGRYRFSLIRRPPHAENDRRGVGTTC
jgi:MFS family permease